MLENCAASCNSCPQPPTPAPTSAPTPAPTPQPTPAPQPTPSCSDLNQNCGNWAASGECEANPSYMLESCAASCGVCTTPGPQPPQPTPGPPPTFSCSDMNQNCGNWAASGECETNPAYML